MERASETLRVAYIFLETQKPEIVTKTNTYPDLRALN